MNAVELLRNRIGAISANVQALADDAAGLDWANPLLPGTSPVGLTLWHLPRTVDWLISTTVRGVPEIADDPAFAELPDPNSYGFGTALSPSAATEAAAQVRAEPLLAYADAVRDMADRWLATLTADDLDKPIAEFAERQRTRPTYCTPDALAEIAHLVDLPLGVLLLRPAISHLFAHMGEIELITQQAKLTR